ncbi:hypothetical protein OZX61_07235 [Acinetobacter sp. ESL0695]|uniref:hypothetical protein n=1 Tax=Acinetobacter sp. ESL0695 TaxID=2983215 RepID=UPI0023F01656|nr:hypothetical protein [Acinetobacter sp. ESL0695]WEV48082.1 hypothetical protein OZX61_07235 [Acinetobacter sp. ESL0695]
MAKQTVNIGANANDGSGDAARSAFNKLNQNDSELYSQLGADANGNLPNALPLTKGGTGATTPEGAAAKLATLGAGQTWRSVKTNRSMDTTYVNTTGRLIAVSIRFESIFHGIGDVRIGLYTGSQLQQQAYQLNARGIGLFCIVENAQSYSLKLLAGTLPNDFSIEEWNELS